MDYKKLKIEKYKYWTIFFNKNQTNLGRTYIWCNRKDVVDFLDMTDKEKEEFFIISKKLRDALTKLFKPDLFNYASLGNITRHLHVHVIPRYASSRTFLGIIFKDRRFGKNYRTNLKFKVPEKILLKIREHIKKELQFNESQ